jgi:hypothetical protein
VGSGRLVTPRLDGFLETLGAWLTDSKRFDELDPTAWKAFAECSSLRASTNNTDVRESFTACTSVQEWPPNRPPRRSREPGEQSRNGAF